MGCGVWDPPNAKKLKKKKKKKKIYLSNVTKCPAIGADKAVFSGFLPHVNFPDFFQTALVADFIANLCRWLLTSWAVCWWAVLCSGSARRRAT
jgi:hypothetical protein